MDHPYQVVQRRVDIVKRVPRWAEFALEKGQHVFRIDDRTVMDMGRTVTLSLGESYTKFSYYL